MASEIDLLQHVNHSRYADYVEDARKLAPYGRDSVSKAIRGVTIAYVKEALHGDLLVIKSWPVDGQRVQSQIERDGAVLAKAIVTF